MCCRIWLRHQAAFRGRVARWRTAVNFMQQDSSAACLTVAVMKTPLDEAELFLGFDEKHPKTQPIRGLFVLFRHTEAPPSLSCMLNATMSELSAGFK